MNIWTCGSSPRSGSRNAWTRIKNVNGASCLSKFGIFSARSKWFPVAIGDHRRNLVISLWRRQSNNQWSGGIAAHPAPKNSECVNLMKNFSPRFFGIRTASSTLIIFQKAKLSTRIITHFYWCYWRTFWRKNAAGSHQGGLVLARQCPGSPDTCNPEETGLPGLPISWSPTLRIQPVGLPPVPWTEKTTERSPFFVRRGGHCCRGDLVGRTNFWIFFWVTRCEAGNRVLWMNIGVNEKQRVRFTAFVLHNWNPKLLAVTFTVLRYKRISLAR